MARNIERITDNCRLLKSYGSWLYCAHCNKTVAYLCYTGYKRITLEFECYCGAHGKIQLKETGAEPASSPSVVELELVKNRYSCPKDGTTFFSVVGERAKIVSYEVQCADCCIREKLKTKNNNERKIEPEDGYRIIITNSIRQRRKNQRTGNYQCP